MDNYDLVVCNPKLKKQTLLDFISNPKNINKKYLDKYVVVHSSGSGGKIGLYAYADQDINAVNVVFVRYVYHAKPLVSMLLQRIAFLGAINGHYAAYTSISRVQNYHLYL